MKQMEKHPALIILEELIAIQSVNPQYDPDAAGESAIADYVEAKFRRAGLKVTRQEVLTGRSNIIAELRVGKPEQTLLLEAHMDTVSLGSMLNPLQPTYKGERLYGRGACDTKGSLAGMLWALEQCVLHREELSCDVVLCASVDEEYQFRGLRSFMELDMPVKGAIVGEPTELRIVTAHKGCMRCAVTTYGKAAHTSVASEGVNAIYSMAKLITYIEEHIGAGLTEISHPLCGAPSLAVSVIQGGEQVNIVPERCEIWIDRRVNPGEHPQEVLQQFELELRSYADQFGIKVSVRELLLDPPLNTAPESEIAACAADVARGMKLQEAYFGVPYGSNASKLQNWKGIPSIVYGPGSIHQAHSDEEYVPIHEVAQAAQFYYNMAMQFGRER